MTQAILLAVVGFVGGALGSMVGLGGGVFMVPALTLFLGIPVHQTVAASLMAVVATSTTAAIAYLRESIANIPLGLSMETLTVVGALVGGLVGTMLSRSVLSAVFGAVMVVVAVYLFVRPQTGDHPVDGDSDLGRLGDSYYDRSLKQTVAYRVRKAPVGIGASLLAGGVSGLLGVGGGFLIVPVMVLAMGVPMRAAVATSSFMLGVTACASALVYLARGFVDPFVTVPVVLGVVVGAYLGSRIARRVRSSVLTVALAIIIFILAVQMILAAFGISLR